MSYQLRFRPEVVTDLEDAVKWYNDRSPGLGAEFLAQCKSELDDIAKSPELVAADSEGIRSSRIHRFPYVVHYRIENSTIVVFAIIFGGRDPSAWTSRV